MVEKFSRYDPADGLDNLTSIEIFMADALQTGDAAHIVAALGVVARAKGMAEMAAKDGLSQEQLHRLMNEDGNPTLETVLAVLKSVGLVLTIARPPVTNMGAGFANARDLAFDGS